MKDTKYFIEITTNDERETLLKSEHVTGWAAANRIIETYKRYNLDNIKIDLYKEINNDVIYCGNFTNIQEKTQLTPMKTPFQVKTRKEKNKNDNIIVLLFGIVFFPIMLLYYLIKGE